MMHKFHPLSEIFPLLEGDELKALTADMKEHGQHDAIVLYEDMVLDGRNREIAGLKAGLTLRYREYPGRPDEARDFVISMNILRRHLTKAQRSEILNQFIIAHSDLSDNSIAKTFIVDHKVVTRHRTKLEALGRSPKCSTRKTSDGRRYPSNRGRKPKVSNEPPRVPLRHTPTGIGALTPEQHAEARAHDPDRKVYLRPIQDEIANNNKVSARNFSTAVRDFGLAAKEFLKITNETGTFERFGFKDDRKPFTPSEYMETLATMENGGALWFGKLSQHFEPLMTALRLVENYGAVISKGVNQ